MADWGERLRPWLNMLLLLLLILPLTRWGWSLWLPPEPEVKPVLAIAPAAATRLPLDVKNLLASTWFGSPVTSVSNQGELPRSSLPLKLRGIIGGAVAVFDAPDPKSRVVKPGQMIQPGIKLLRVESSAVVLDNQGQHERLWLDVPQAISPLASPGPVAGAYPPGIEPVTPITD